jgi:hypothetical protein
MATNPIARLIVESLAVNLASFPEQALGESGISESIADGIRAARVAFHQHVTESEVEILRRDLFDEVRQGLSDLDAEKKASSAYEVEWPAL